MEIGMGKVRINAEYVNELNQSLAENANENVILDTYLSDALEDNEIYFGQNTINFDQILSGTSKFFFFVGYRCTGKTMFLKQYFKMKGNTPFIDPELKRLVLPILGCGDAEDKTPYDRVSDAIRGLCDRIAYEYPQTQQQFTASGIESFFQFILDTRIDYLPELTFSEQSKLSQSEQHCARIDKMQKENKLAYQLSRLKFYLRYYCSDINELVIVLDNIQNIFNESEKQKEFMDVFMDAFECIQNKGINGKGNWKIFIVIAVRPRDYRIIKSFDKISSYADNRVWNDSRINSTNLFGKVIEKDAKGADFEKIIELDSEMVSSNSSDFGVLLSTLSQKFGCKYATMIEKLCFYNMDLIMNAYKRILINTTWVREGGFRFTSDAGYGNGLAFNNITCIRALACGNERIYKRWENLNEMDDLDKLIPNILYNEEDADYRLINLYTIKYFLRHFNSKMELGENYIMPKDYMDTFCSLLDVDLQTCFFSTNYLFQREILRRSVYDIETAAGAPYNDTLGTDNKLYITSKGTALWDMFRNDSVLLEICREDMYLLDDMTEDDTKSSYDLMMEGKQFILFSKLLNIIREIFEQEFFYYQQACLRGYRDKYREAFGKQPISMVLLQGVTKSIQYSGCSSIMKNRNELEAEIITKWKEWGK